MTRLVLVMLAALAPLAVAQYEPTPKPFSIREPTPYEGDCEQPFPGEEHEASCSSQDCFMSNVFDYNFADLFDLRFCRVEGALDIYLKGEYVVDADEDATVAYLAFKSRDALSDPKQRKNLKCDGPWDKSADYKECAVNVEFNNADLNEGKLHVFVQGKGGTNADNEAGIDDTHFKGVMEARVCCDYTSDPSPHPTSMPTSVPTTICPDDWELDNCEEKEETVSCTSEDCSLSFLFMEPEIAKTADIKVYQAKLDLSAIGDITEKRPETSEITFQKVIYDDDKEVIKKISFATCNKETEGLKDTCGKQEYVKCGEHEWDYFNDEDDEAKNNVDFFQFADDGYFEFTAEVFIADVGINEKPGCESKAKAKFEYCYCYKATSEPTPEPTHAPTTCEQYVDSLLANNGCPTCPTCINSLDCECGDSSSWTKLNDPGRDCSWVASYPEKRCQVKGEGAVFAFEECQEACGSCGKACTDSTTWHKAGDETKDCAWVKRQQNRCGSVDDDGSYAYENCRKSCQTCQYC